jgi:hypothetical protein
LKSFQRQCVDVENVIAEAKKEEVRTQLVSSERNCSGESPAMDGDFVQTKRASKIIRVVDKVFVQQKGNESPSSTYLVQ